VKRAVLVLVAWLAAGCAAAPRLAPQAMLPDAVKAGPGQYLVVTIHNPVAPVPVRAASTRRGYDGGGGYLSGNLARTDGRKLAADYGLVEVSSWPIALLGVDCLVYGVPAGREPAAMIASLERDRRVESVQVLQAFDTQASGYNDPYAALQKNVARLGIPEAHALSRGSGVKVAVIDTGADLSHPDLRSGGARSRNFVDDDAPGFRGDAHGTAVAGVIGAVPNNGVGIVGIAPDAELLVYKACWRAAEAGAPSVCNTFTLAQALAAAIEAHADVINLSLGGPADALLTRLVRRGLEGGAIVVGAAPRDGTRHGFPVGIDGVIAVGIDDAAGVPSADLVRAPGHDVLSLAPDGHYDFYSGSSLASAEVAGIVALMRSRHPHLTGQEASAALVSASKPAGLNACAAVAALRHGGSCAETAGVRPTSP
jgi:subtilisin family serine protease